MTNRFLFTATIMLAIAFTQSHAQQKGSFTDPRDKKTYKTVKIGEQTWMAENLDYHGEDGFLGLCYGDEPQKKIRKPENCKKYGRLYDWDEAMKACPAGWHLPTPDEWYELLDFAGGNEVAGKKLRAKSGWKEENLSKCKWIEEEKIDNRGRIIAAAIEHDDCSISTDEYGFSAFPNSSGLSGQWWTASDTFIWYMDHNNEGVGRHYGDRNDLFSVRCLHGSKEVEKGTLKNPSARDIDMGSGDGSRSKAEIMAVVNVHMFNLRRTYNNYLKTNQNLTGKVTLKFIVAPSGDITSINIVSSTTGNSEFDNAIKDAVATWRWKAIKSGNTTPTVPFNFEQ
jgi:TonB family protein